MNTPQIVNLCGININIVRTNRKKTIAVKVNQGDVSVSVPKNASLSHIETVINNKSKWIQQKLLQQENYTPLKVHEFRAGETFLYLGQERTLDCVTGIRSAIELDEQKITLYSHRPLKAVTIKNRLNKWYRAQAQLYLSLRTRELAENIGLKPRRINTRTYRSRWGCCSSNREITYNWQIIMAPEHIIDYLIVHELCHMKEHNHSPRYWSHVAAVLPDYKQSKKWLDQNGHQFHF